MKHKIYLLLSDLACYPDCLAEGGLPTIQGISTHGGPHVQTQNNDILSIIILACTGRGGNKVVNLLGQ